MSLFTCDALQAVQYEFEEAQATHDPNQVAAVLQIHPYHIDTLLAMFDLYRCGTSLPLCMCTVS